jgi:hypothetical protein
MRPFRPSARILACDFPSADVAQALLPAGAETLLGAGEPRSPNACLACARPCFSHRLYNPTAVGGRADFRQPATAIRLHRARRDRF